jgi:hypothetical protein
MALAGFLPPFPRKETWMPAFLMKWTTGAAKAGSGNHVTDELFARRPCKPRAAHSQFRL